MSLKTMHYAEDIKNIKNDIISCGTPF